MAMVAVQASGVLAFLFVTIIIGVQLRRNSESEFAARVSRASHLAFWAGLIAPWAIGMAYPGPSALDAGVGLSRLPLDVVVRVGVGAPFLVLGVVFMQLSISGLKRKGGGAPAFKLTGDVVSTGVYALSRNPMSLGFYVALVGGALLSGSSWVLLYTVLGVLPAHLFNLLYFEQLELSLRYGESYEAYRRTTPFLIPRIGSRSSAVG